VNASTVHEDIQCDPGFEVVRGDTRHADKESAFIAQQYAKAAADIAHFLRGAGSFLADRSYLLARTPFIEKEGGQKFLAQWDQTALEVCKYKEKISCINDYVIPLAMLYNIQHYREAGLDPKKPPAT